MNHLAAKAGKAGEVAAKALLIPASTAQALKIVDIFYYTYVAFCL